MCGLPRRDDSGRRLSGHLGAFVADLRRERTAVTVLLYAGLAILVHEYVLPFATFHRVFPDARAPLGPFLWWAGGVALVWMLLPALLARRLGFSLGSQGLGAGTLARDWRVFAVLIAVAVPLTALAATQPAFAGAYPLLRAERYTWPLLAGYWALYGLQFVAVEYFFRGFLPFTLAPRLGAGAAAVSAVPYALIHLLKPWPEAVGAVFGGYALAWLALRVGSIWGGVALHVAIAFTMDAMALSAAGAWP